MPTVYVSTGTSRLISEKADEMKRAREAKYEQDAYVSEKEALQMLMEPETLADLEKRGVDLAPEARQKLEDAREEQGALDHV